MLMSDQPWEQYPVLLWAHSHPASCQVVSDSSGIELAPSDACKAGVILSAAASCAAMQRVTANTVVGLALMPLRSSSNLAVPRSVPNNTVLCGSDVSTATLQMPLRPGMSTVTSWISTRLGA